MELPLSPLDRRKVVALAFNAIAAASAVAFAIVEQRASNHRVLHGGRLAASADPLAAEFTRCQALGDAGARDAGCLAAWAESRRRFIAPKSTAAALAGTPTPQIRPQVGKAEAH